VKTEWIAHGNGQLADPQRIVSVQGRVGHFHTVRMDQRQVSRVILTDQTRLDPVSLGQGDGEFGRILYHMTVGEDVTIRRDRDPRPAAL
jgi:hypothetical protein